MKTTSKTGDVLEPKTHLAEPLNKLSIDKVECIPQRADSEAGLVPVTTDALQMRCSAAQKMLILMKKARVQDELDIRFLINAGRDG